MAVKSGKLKKENNEYVGDTNKTKQKHTWAQVSGSPVSLLTSF